ncbi:hypothetical protein CEXT_144511 [Caerostris extrusa]|uniref:Uncharacterized protein n=1 Tax=Caerostris extrusa TaxID=172846 RepID=A0AAV4Y6J2_CAEEX|nr:hypothetical protein CEXT_144511 [Caerostris extrusa]
MERFRTYKTIPRAHPHAEFRTGTTTLGPDSCLTSIWSTDYEKVLSAFPICGYEVHLEANAISGGALLPLAANERHKQALRLEGKRKMCVSRIYFVAWFLLPTASFFREAFEGQVSSCCLGFTASSISSVPGELRLTIGVAVASHWGVGGGAHDAWTQVVCAHLSA